MKKPRKPRKPTEPRYFLASVAQLVNRAMGQQNNKPLRLADFGVFCAEYAKKRMVSELGFNEKHIHNDHLVLIGSQLFWEIYKVPEAVLKKLPKGEAARVRRYKKSLKNYETKMKKYKINLGLWEAWQLGKEKDKLNGKKITLTRKLEVLEKQLGEVEKKISVKLEGSESEDVD